MRIVNYAPVVNGPYVTYAADVELDNGQIVSLNSKEYITEAQWFELAALVTPVEQVGEDG